jgi:spore maturation protein B
MSNYILPFLFLILFIFVAGKKINAFDSFVEGAKKSLQICANIFPFFAAIFMAVQIFSVSGAAALLSRAVSPVFSLIGIPEELSQLVILRPFSGSGSLALVTEIYAKYGADSYVSRCASILMGSTETVFYLIAVYFTDTQVKKLRYALPVGLLCCLSGAVISCLLCKIMYF